MPQAQASGSRRSGLASTAVEAYRAYLERQSARLLRRSHRFVAALLAGELERARTLFAWSREPYEAIQPVVGAFEDLDLAIDARVNDVPPTAWTGFHRIEEALWVQRSLARMDPVAVKLRTDVEKLCRRLRTVPLDPAGIASGATELLGTITSSKIIGEEDRYSHTDLWDIQANVDGAQVAFTALAGLIEARDAELAKELRGRFADVEATLDRYRSGDGFVLSTKLTREDTRRLSQAIDALGEPFSRVAGLVAAG